MNRKLQISVIIPTYNRKEPVLQALDSLSRQTLPPDRYEVIIVDDGSPDDASFLEGRRYPFALRRIRQPNRGATAARNYGAQHSRGDILVFMDDDVVVSPPALAALAQACHRYERVVVLGALEQRCPDEASLYARFGNELPPLPDSPDGDVFLPFAECNTQLLAVKRDDFFEIGMLQDPTGGRGWPNWDDVDFGYRAHLHGFRLLRCAEAAGEHRDYSLAELGIAARRWERACKSAVWLFQTHPGLRPHIPMLADKTPIAWGQDSPALILRKMARHVASSRPALASLEAAARLLERYFPAPNLLRPLYRWVNGGYMFRGYRAGLRALKQEGKR